MMIYSAHHLNSLCFKLLLVAGLVAILLVVPMRPAQAQTETTGVGVTQTATPDPATVGEPVTFTVTLTNGYAVPQHLGLKTFLSPDVASVSATPSQGTCNLTTSNDVLCSLGTVPSGASVTVAVTAIPRAAGNLTNLANGGGEFGPVNSVPATVVVNPAIDPTTVTNTPLGETEVTPAFPSRETGDVAPALSETTPDITPLTTPGATYGVT